MPKIRGIKPEIWTDEDFIELSPLARLLFIGLWNFACDNGHVQDKSRQIKMRILPGDDVNCAELLREVESSGLIHRSNEWITIPNFRKHQRLDKRWFQTCAAPDCDIPGNGERETRGGHDVATSSPRGGHDVTTSGPRRHSDVDVDGDVDSEDKTSSGSLREPDRDDVALILDTLDAELRSNDLPAPNRTIANKRAARLLIDKDGYTVDQILWIIRWAQNDEFWTPNIRSASKLREKFPQLKAQAMRTHTSRRQQETDAQFAAAARRFGASQDPFSPKEITA